MGDLSSEPSMEEILSSIKRIIAEEGEATPGRGRRAGRATPPPPASEDEVLELSDPMPQERTAAPPSERPADAIRPAPGRSSDRIRVADTSRDDLPAPVVAKAPERRPDAATESGAPRDADRVEPVLAAPPIVSADTVEATRGALDQLSRMLVKPEPGADGTLEGMVREMLRPMLRDWLDAHLPVLVEDMVAREIEKITSNRR